MMQIRFFWLYMSFLALGGALETLNSSALEDWPISTTGTNLTSPLLGIPTPPAEFHISTTIAGAKLNVTACLMVSVAALKILALGEWDAKIIDGTEYTLDGYPEISILVSTPKRKRNIQARFVNWAITVGVYRMILARKFELAAFELRWSNDLVGWVHIVNNPPQSGLIAARSQANESVAVTERASILLPLSSTGKLPEMEVQLTLSFRPPSYVT